MQQVEEIREKEQLIEQQAEELSKKRMVKQQNDELMKWIELLKEERMLFEKQNKELENIRQWQWEKLMSIPFMSQKIKKEYDEFIQKL